MKSFQAPLDDIFFCLNHIADVNQLNDWDADLSVEIASVHAKFVEQEIAPLNEIGDREGCRLEDGKVLMPSGFVDAYRRYCDDGWQGLSLPETFGGMGMNSILQEICYEVLSGANHSLEMIVALTPGATRLLLKHGSEAQQEAWIPQLASGEYLATMCLTEPGAGSDLARIRCKATETDEGWRIDGEKIFISGGGQDLSDGILHLVLARTSDDGIRGLSLFGCTSHLSDGSENRISVERIEEKMGMHASPTCQLHFDSAHAELIGKPGQGLMGMFSMMNHARIDVALQGVAHASRAYDIAATYAADRVQGKGPEGQPTTIDQHEDVKRMLDEMAALSIGGRAMAYTVLVNIVAGKNSDLVDFLTPLVKVFCSEAGIRTAYLGQQILGGYGYLTEYHVDQVYRDARITAIYEGTNGIHAKSLLTRELNMPGAEAFEQFIAQLAEQHGAEVLKASLQLWQDTKSQLQAKSAPLTIANDFMTMTCKLLFVALWVKIQHHEAQSPNQEAYQRASQFVLRREPIDIEALAKQIAAELCTR